MRFRNSMVLAGLFLVLPQLGGCSLEAVMQSCADCGEIRSITPRAVSGAIRLPAAEEALGVVRTAAQGEPRVYHVRVRMDRGGSRDFLLPAEPGLKIGDRVHIGAGPTLLRATPGYRWSWT